MSSEDILYLHSSSNSNECNDLGRKRLCVESDVKDIVDEPVKADDIDDGLFVMEDLGQSKQENQHAHTTVKELEKDPSGQPLGLEVVESGSEVDIIQCFKNGDVSANINGSVGHNKEVDIHEKLGVKRSQEECSSMESSVRVVYSSLPRRSKRKLEESLNQWSEWHSKNCALDEDPSDSLESGEETYFPALNVGSDKPSTVSFSMDVQVLKKQRKGSVSLNHECSPLYDRGFAGCLAADAGATEERGVDLREAPRCFNCSSYNHPLSECTKPVNKTAITSARKEFQSKKNQNGSPRVPSRYYQESPGGKFDGVKPGALSAETRKLLGLGELDPPPWFNRMRELGYPPGYLDLEEENQPSGITIFGNVETQTAEVRNGPQLDQRKSQKMMIEFPGINAPIPENADQNRWATPRSPNVPDLSLNRPDNRLMHGAYGTRSPIEGPFSFGFGSPPVSQHPYYQPSGPFSPIDSPISGFGSPPMSQHPYNYQPSGPFSPIDSPISGFGSPPVSQHPYHYQPSEPFSPTGIPIPGNPHYWRPFRHYNHGSF